MKRKNFQDVELPSFYKKRNDESKKSDEKLVDSAQPFHYPEFVDSAAGFPPFVRGIHPTMYLTKPWESGNSYIISQKSFQNLEEARERLADKPLDKMPVLFSLNKSCLPLIAAYLTVAGEQQIPNAALTFFLEDTLESSSVKTNSVIRERVIKGLFSHIKSEKLTSFEGIRISGSGLRKKGFSIEEELAQSLLRGWNYLDFLTQLGLSPDKAAPYLSFSWGIGADFSREISKIRAGRMLWAKIVKTYNPSDLQSMALHLHINGLSPSSSNSSDRLISEQLAAMAGIFGGAQQLKINTGSKEMNRKLQRFLKHEAPVNHPVDPWAGSHEIESLTDQIARQTWKLITKASARPELNKMPSSNQDPKSDFEKNLPSQDNNSLELIMDKVRSNLSFKSIEKELFN